jgi:hypothetical protein
LCSPLLYSPAGLLILERRAIDVALLDFDLGESEDWRPCAQPIGAYRLGATSRSALVRQT